MALLSDKTKTIAFLIGIVFLFVGMTFSKAFTSLATVYFIVLFIIQGEYKHSFLTLIKNTSSIYFLIFITWMLISICWSDYKSVGFQLFVSNLNLFLWPVLMVLFMSK